MVTALTVMNVYILDWSAADADDYDLDGETEGTDYCKIPIPKMINMRASQDGTSIAFFGGDGYLFRYDRTKRIISITGKVGTRTELGYIDKFFSTRQGAGSDPDYLVAKFATSDYLPAYNYDGTDMNGVFRGWFKIIPLSNWNSDDSQVHTIQIEFHVVWS